MATMDIVIKKLKRGPFRAVADREVWVDGEHRATFRAERGRRLYLQPAYGSGSIYKMVPPAYPKVDRRERKQFYSSVTTDDAEMVEVVREAIKDGKLPTAEAQRHAAEEARQRRDQEVAERDAKDAMERAAPQMADALLLCIEQIRADAVAWNSEELPAIIAARAALTAAGVKVP